MNNDRFGHRGQGGTVTLHGQGSHSLFRDPVTGHIRGLGILENMRAKRQRAMDAAEIVREVERRRLEELGDVMVVETEGWAQQAKQQIVAHVLAATSVTSEQIRKNGGDMKRQIVETTGECAMSIAEAGTKGAARIEASNIDPELKDFLLKGMASLTAEGIQGAFESGYEAIKSADRNVDSAHLSRFARKD